MAALVAGMAVPIWWWLVPEPSPVLARLAVSAAVFAIVDASVLLGTRGGRRDATELLAFGRSLHPST